jgi:hypothetical protein
LPPSRWMLLPFIELRAGARTRDSPLDEVEAKSGQHHDPDPRVVPVLADDICTERDRSGRHASEDGGML